MCTFAILMPVCALTTAASVSLIAEDVKSFTSSARSDFSGLAAATTVSNNSSAWVTTSMASGRASSSDFASRCSASMSFSSASFCFCLSSSSCCFCANSCFAFFISCARVAWTLLTRGVNLLSAATALGTVFLASMMSAESTLLVSVSAFSWFCNSPSTTLRLSFVTSPSSMARAFSNACVASISATTTRSVALCVLSSISAWAAAESWLASSSSFSAFALAPSFTSVPDFTCLFGSMTRSVWTSPSHGIRQPAFGGSTELVSQRDHT
mmetsp:Transcript_66904/g.193345  ORF Transcript_66904/g.193345 Transcript_66904/m.193345 type:complete len:268 (-) Transcript_66904:557-1360(-)